MKIVQKENKKLKECMKEHKSHNVEREQLLIELTNKTQTLEGEIGLLR